MWRKGCILLFEWTIGYHCQSKSFHLHGPINHCAGALLSGLDNAMRLKAHNIEGSWAPKPLATCLYPALHWYQGPLHTAAAVHYYLVCQNPASNKLIVVSCPYVIAYPDALLFLKTVPSKLPHGWVKEQDKCIGWDVFDGLVVWQICYDCPSPPGHVFGLDRCCRSHPMQQVVSILSGLQVPDKDHVWHKKGELDVGVGGAQTHVEVQSPQCGQ
jgi:hypothetical protein